MTISCSGSCCAHLAAPWTLGRLCCLMSTFQYVTSQTAPQYLAAEAALLPLQHLVSRLGAVLPAAPLVQDHLRRLAGVVSRAASHFHHLALPGRGRRLLRLRKQSYKRVALNMIRSASQRDCCCAVSSVTQRDCIGTGLRGRRMPPGVPTWGAAAAAPASGPPAASTASSACLFWMCSLYRLGCAAAKHFKLAGGAQVQAAALAPGAAQLHVHNAQCMMRDARCTSWRGCAWRGCLLQSHACSCLSVMKRTCLNTRSQKGHFCSCSRLSTVDGPFMPPPDPELRSDARRLDITTSEVANVDDRNCSHHKAPAISSCAPDHMVLFLFFLPVLDAAHAGGAGASIDWAMRSEATLSTHHFNTDAQS